MLTNPLAPAPLNPQRAPLISVILIFFNEETFIAEAIESVLAQTYSNWELLLADDGSSDRTPQIAQTYASACPHKIRYLTHPNRQNKGMSATRNLGLQQAQGDYLTFLDADDVWLPRKLAEQLQILQTHPDIALVCGRTQWWYSWTNQPEDRDRDFNPTLHLPLNAPISSPHILMQFLKDEWTSLHGVMVRKEAARAVGGYENQFRGMYEDQAFHAKLCLRYQAWIADTCWYRYRQHATSCCTAAGTAGWLAARQTYLEWLEAYLIQQPQPLQLPSVKHSVKQPVKRFVRRELWRYRAPMLFYIRTKLQRIRAIRKAAIAQRKAPDRPAQPRTPRPRQKQETPC